MSKKFGNKIFFLASALGLSLLIGACEPTGTGGTDGTGTTPTETPIVPTETPDTTTPTETPITPADPGTTITPTETPTPTPTVTPTTSP